MAAATTITLVLGGARSGKSELAEQLASVLPPPITYVATAVTGPDLDPDFAARIESHRRRRPASWQTIEAGADLAEVLAGLDGTALVDALGPWVAASPDFGADPARLCEALRARPGSTVVVSDEVGLGVHPFTQAGGRFRDAMGIVNQAVAAIADDVLLVVAGRALRLGAGGLGIVVEG